MIYERRVSGDRSKMPTILYELWRQKRETERRIYTLSRYKMITAEQTSIHPHDRVRSVTMMALSAKEEYIIDSSVSSLSLSLPAFVRFSFFADVTISCRLTAWFASLSVDTLSSALSKVRVSAIPFYYRRAQVTSLAWVIVLRLGVYGVRVYHKRNRKPRAETIIRGTRNAESRFRERSKRDRVCGSVVSFPKHESTLNNRIKSARMLCGYRSIIAASGWGFKSLWWLRKSSPGGILYFHVKSRERLLARSTSLENLTSYSRSIHAGNGYSWAIRYSCRRLFWLKWDINRSSPARKKQMFYARTNDHSRRAFRLSWWWFVRS